MSLSRGGVEEDWRIFSIGDLIRIAIISTAVHENRGMMKVVSSFPVGNWISWEKVACQYCLWILGPS